MSSPKLVIFMRDENLRRETLSVLRYSNGQIPFEEVAGDWNALLHAVAQHKPELLLLDLQAAAPGDLRLAIRQLRHYAPRVKVALLHTDPNPDAILGAMRAGVNEFLHPPLEQTLLPALARLLDTSANDGTTQTRGKVIGFLSAKGGCGATTLACHVACELQQLTRKKVLLADLDLTSGLVSFLMKTPGSYSVLDGIQNLARLDESLWKALIVEHKSDLSVIPAPASYSRWDHPDEAGLRQLLQFMRTQHDWVVLDLGRSLNSIATAVLEEIDQLLLVSTLEVVALHGLKSIVHGLADQGDKLQLVLNRTPKTMDISAQELEKILGRSIYATLPNDYMALYQSYSSGNLLDSNNRLAQHFSMLASRIAGLPPEKPKRKFALFG